jgi:hypothetical protein
MGIHEQDRNRLFLCNDDSISCKDIGISPENISSYLAELLRNTALKDGRITSFRLKMVYGLKGRVGKV